MQLAATNPRPAFGLPVGTIRREGPTAPPAPDVVAQVMLEFPASFGAQGLIDVTAGASLATFGALRDAIWAARDLSVGRASLGVVRQADGAFTVNELTVPDVLEHVPDWGLVKDVTLVMGPDPVLPRSIHDLRQLRDAPVGNGVLEAVWTRSGNTRWDVRDGPFYVGFNHM